MANQTEVDARAAARQVLTCQALSTRKDTTGQVESLRMLKDHPPSTGCDSGKTLTLITSLLFTAPATVRQRYKSMTTTTLIMTLSLCRSPADVTDPINGTLVSVKSLATTYTMLRALCDELDTKITDLVRVINSGMTHFFGYRAVTGAELIVSVGENTQRIRSQVALAHLWGVASIPASSKANEPTPVE